VSIIRLKILRFLALSRLEHIYMNSFYSKAIM